MLTDGYLTDDLNFKKTTNAPLDTVLTWSKFWKSAGRTKNKLRDIQEQKNNYF